MLLFSTSQAEVYVKDTRLMIRFCFQRCLDQEALLKMIHEEMQSEIWGQSLSSLGHLRFWDAARLLTTFIRVLSSVSLLSKHSYLLIYSLRKPGF